MVFLCNLKDLVYNCSKIMSGEKEKENEDKVGNVRRKSVRMRTRKGMSVGVWVREGRLLTEFPNPAGRTAGDF